MSIRVHSWFIGLLFSAVLSQAAEPGPLARHDKLALRKVVPNHTQIPVYGLLELNLDLTATYDNPFDPDQIDVHAVLTSPRGQQLQVNAFLDEVFTRKLEQGAEKIEPIGEPAWRVRFTPSEAGRWSYEVIAKDKSGTVQLKKQEFQVNPSKAPGFIRLGAQNRFGFVYDNGAPFFPVGENLCWGGQRGSFDYVDWLPQLSGAGGNFIRIWMSSWNCALEWSKSEHGEWRNGQYNGAGFYSLDNAWKLDTILDQAQTNGVNVMLCLGTYGEFNDGGYFGEGQWKANPYNATNGGPCLKPEGFWTNSTARKLYQRRLRYLAARYGYRTNLHSWEFWNEAKAPAPWVGEMARFMKGTGEFQGHPADPHRHLVSTTYGDDAVWQTAEIDFTQTHSYGTGNIPDHATTVLKEARSHLRFNKPHLMAEFGIDWRSPDSKYDPDHKGINFHNALWASVMSGDGGGAMIWWWDNYIHPQKLYEMYGPVRRFVDQVPWAAGPWQPLEASASEAAVQVAGLVSGRHAVLWVHNREHQWKNVYEKKEVPTVKSSEIILRNIPEGPYEVQWWDTWQGKVIRTDRVQASGNGLKLSISDLATDIAARLTAR